MLLLGANPQQVKQLKSGSIVSVHPKLQTAVCPTDMNSGRVNEHRQDAPFIFAMSGMSRIF